MAASSPAPEQLIRDHGTPDQQRVCDRLWAGAFETPEQMAEYYTVMGPLYSRRYDPAVAASVRGRAIHSPEPLNRAFGPGGVLRTSTCGRNWGGSRRPR